MALTLRPMRPAEFGVYQQHAIDRYARDIAAARGLPLEQARTASAAEFARLLPAGPDSPDQLLFVAVDERRDRVGVLWLCLASPTGAPRTGWVYDIEVDEEFRGRGHGRSIMLLAERVCRDHGLGALSLNVFASNTTARVLYESLGYATRSILMTKQLD